MLKNWKNLFIKTEETSEKKSAQAEVLSFPIANPSSQFNQPSTPAQEISDPIIKEVLQVYENGLDSINMPGYDFYEFYQAISSTGQGSEQAYNMAYQMARTLDKTITPQKLIHDAEFYISKINEVHSQYVSQGQQKLNALQEKKASEKSKLNAEIDQASARVSQLRGELHQLDTDINNKRNTLSKMEDGFYPQEKSIRGKLDANDQARNTSIDKLNIIKEGLLRYIKG